MADTHLQVAPGDTVEIVGVPGSSPPPPPPPPPPTGKVAHGLFVVSQRPADVDALAHAYGYGAPLDVSRITVYTTGNAGWAGIAGYTPNTPVTRKLLLGVSLCPRGATIADVAGNLGTFHELAGKLPPGTDCRVGWEPNIAAGDFPWSGTDPAAYAAAVNPVFQIFHDAGFPTTFCLQATNPVPGGGDITRYEDALDWGVIDNVGTDYYAKGGGTFADQMNPAVKPCGLAAVWALAARKGKRPVIPEWGIDGTDDGAWVTSMGHYMAGDAATLRPPAYWEAYFAYPDSTRNLVHYPQSLAAYKATVIPA